jgi:hypothetical protein
MPKRAKASIRRPAARKSPPLTRDTKPPVRIARVPKGKRPQYFSDPAIDKLLWATMTLAQELAVTRDRLDALERLLAEKRVLKSDAVDRYVPPPAVEAKRDARRSAYIARVLRAVEAELEENVGRDHPRSQDEVIAAVAS